MTTEHHKVLSANLDNENLHQLDTYISLGGFEAFKKALKMEPAQIIEEVKKSGLRGRGGACFPTGVKWSFMPTNSDKESYLINNADESEPGTYKDRLLMERNPMLVIEGMLIASLAMKAVHSFIYVRGEYAFPYERTKDAIKECYERGYLGKNIQGSNFSHEMTIHRGAGAYICGEETALMESLEGKKGQPRLKPPFPAGYGLYGKHTTINNCETLATVPWIIQNGGEAYSKIGVESCPGTHLMCISGHVNKPGIYEIDMGYPILDFIENEAGGIRNGNKLKAVVPGGSSTVVLTAEDCKGVNIDAESLKAAGSAMGSSAMIVMDDTTDMTEAVLNLSHFYSHESCGQCTPCREGGHWIEKIFARIAKCEGQETDLELIEKVCGQIGGHTICAFGDTMILPYLSIIEKFKDEFVAKIKKSNSSKSLLDRRALNFELGAH